MQPYQEAAQSAVEQTKRPLNFLGRAASMLSYYIPANLAVKGINRLAPKMKGFLDTAKNHGYGDEDIIKFLREKQEKIQTQTEQEKQTKQPENKNIIEKYSPELFQFMKNLISKGRSPIEAGELAQLEGKGFFKKTIDKMTKENKAPWSFIVQSVFGTAQQPQGTQQTGPTQQSPISQQSQQGVSNADQQLMAMLDKFSQSLR